MKRRRMIGALGIGLALIIAGIFQLLTTPKDVKSTKNIHSLSESPTLTVSKLNVLGTSSNISITQANKTEKNVSETQPTTNTNLPSILYSVSKVVDGDTIKVTIDNKEETLRLIGIDTPETVDPRKPVQCFGNEASNKAKEILNGSWVALEDDPTQGERDKYSRLLRYVFLADGTNFNLLMLSEGYAYEYTYSFPYKYQEEFKAAQEEARLTKKGLWQDNACK